MFSAAKISGPTAGVPDPQFNYVTALLHGDGTNGAQNNTFLDSSSNAFTITRNGTPTQGSFSPYGTLWSNYFNGTTDYLSYASNSNLILGTGDFTFEGWFFQTTNNTYPVALEIGAHISTTGIVFITKNGGNATLYSGGFYGTAATILNQWNHIAWVRSSGSLKIYVNGIGNTPVSFTNNLTDVSTITVGQSASVGTSIYFYNGNMSNLRLVKSAVYTSNFTPSTTPLTAISGTQLLTCQSNKFVDNSANVLSVTSSGSPSVQRFNPFLPTSSQAYSTSVYGGSGYFNGSTDYLSAPSNSAFNLSGDFTFECWFNSSNGGSISSLLVEVPTTGGLQIYFNSGNLNVSSYGVSGILTYAYSVPSNTWVHLALVRSGTGTNNLVLYLNGISVATASNNTTNFAQGAFRIGGTSFYFNGYISDVRLVKGTAVYTSNFTPPTSPLTSITNTSILTNMTNAGIYDNAMMNDLITVGSAQISTSVKKYGTGSLNFNGSSDYLITNSYPKYYFGTGNFTIECWVYLTASPTTNFILDFRDASHTTAPIFLWGDITSGVLYWDSLSGTQIYGSATWNTNTWYHVAYVRNGTTGTIYQNGVSIGSGTDSTNYTITSNTATIGARYASTFYYFQGYIDDLRITNGYARYTSNFTPPTSAFPNY